MFNSHFSPEVWADVIEDTLRGNSIGYTAKRLGLYHQATFAMRHKILIPLQQMPEIGNICLGEVSELDETFILDCYTSKPLDDDISRKPRKHGAKAEKRGISSEYVCICSGIQRNGDAYAAAVNRAKPDAEELHPRTRRRRHEVRIRARQRKVRVQFVAPGTRGQVQR